MNAVSLALIFTGVTLNAVAQLLLKLGVNSVGHFEFTRDNVLPVGLQLLSQWPILGGLACYGISVVVWILGLSRVEVSIAYPMLSLGYILNALGAWYFLGESLSTQRLIAIGIIMMGVILLARS